MHTPNPKDSKYVFDHASQMSKKDRLLPVPRESMVYGVLAKNHLVNWVQAMDSHMTWEHDSSIMEVRADDQELSEHTQYGFFMHVIDFQAIVDFPEKVKALMRTNNKDQIQAMPEHEMAMLYKTYEIIQESSSLQPGQLLWEAVREKTLQAAGTEWEEDELVACFNFGMIVDRGVMQNLEDVHFQHVNPTMLVMRASFFALLAGSQPRQYCSLALAVRQYMADQNELVCGCRLHLSSARQL